MRENVDQVRLVKSMAALFSFPSRPEKAVGRPATRKGRFGGSGSGWDVAVTYTALPISAIATRENSNCASVQCAGFLMQPTFNL
jgi:hypothetical protein